MGKNPTWRTKQLSSSSRSYAAGTTVRRLLTVQLVEVTVFLLVCDSFVDSGYLCAVPDVKGCYRYRELWRMPEFLYIPERTWNFVHLFFIMVQTRSVRTEQEVSSRSDLWYTEKLIIFYFLLPSDFWLVNVHTVVCVAPLKSTICTSS